MFGRVQPAFEQSLTTPSATYSAMVFSSSLSSCRTARLAGRILRKKRADPFGIAPFKSDVLHRGKLEFLFRLAAPPSSLKQLQEHIDAYVNAYNDKAEPFVWTKKKVRQRQFKDRRITLQTALNLSGMLAQPPESLGTLMPEQAS
jgi:hypothetical protein